MGWPHGEHVDYALIRSSAVEGRAEGGEGGCYPEVVRMGLEVALGGAAVVLQVCGAISPLPE